MANPDPSIDATVCINSMHSLLRNQVDEIIVEQIEALMQRCFALGRRDFAVEVRLQADGEIVETR